MGWDISGFFLGLTTNSLFWVVVIGGLTIFATLVAPKLGSRGKLGFEIRSVVGLRLSKSHEKVSVQYSVDGNRVDSDIYVADLKLKNLGSRDLSQERFLAPATFQFPEQCQVLSIDDNGDTELRVWTEDDNKVCVDWDLLKKGEAISISVVCAVDRSDDLVVGDIKFKTRLVDVDHRAMSRPVLPLILGAYVLLIGVAALVYILDEGLSANLFYGGSQHIGGLIFTSEDDIVRICTERESAFSFRECSKFPISSLVPANISIQRTTIGVSKLYFFGVLIAAALYLLPPYALLKFRSKTKFRSTLRKLLLSNSEPSS